MKINHAFYENSITEIQTKLPTIDNSLWKNDQMVKKYQEVWVFDHVIRRYKNRIIIKHLAAHRLSKCSYYEKTANLYAMSSIFDHRSFGDNYFVLCLNKISITLEILMKKFEGKLLPASPVL